MGMIFLNHKENECKPRVMIVPHSSEEDSAHKGPSDCGHMRANTIRKRDLPLLHKAKYTAYELRFPSFKRLSEENKCKCLQYAEARKMMSRFTVVEEIENLLKESTTLSGYPVLDKLVMIALKNRVQPDLTVVLNPLPPPRTGSVIHSRVAYQSGVQVDTSVTNARVITNGPKCVIRTAHAMKMCEKVRANRQAALNDLEEMNALEPSEDRDSLINDLNGDVEFYNVQIAKWNIEYNSAREDYAQKILHANQNNSCGAKLYKSYVNMKSDDPSSTPYRIPPTISGILEKTVNDSLSKSRFAILEEYNALKAMLKALAPFAEASGELDEKLEEVDQGARLLIDAISFISETYDLKPVPMEPWIPSGMPVGDNNGRDEGFEGDDVSAEDFTEIFGHPVRERPSALTWNDNANGPEDEQMSTEPLAEDMEM